jgi:hypothetical protein
MRFDVACVWFAAVASACAACGGGDDDDGDVFVPADTAQSGTRLKLGWFVLDDGLRTWSMKLRDSLLDLPCSPRMWRDGKLRCSPESAGAVVFRDDDCTQPFMQGEGPYAITSEPGCDDNELDRVYYAAAGDSMTIPTAYGGEPGNCRELPPPPPFGRWIGRAAEEREPSEFVELRHVYQGDGRVQIETLSSTDGLLLPVQPYDTQLDAACRNFDRLFNTNAMQDVTSMPCVLDAFEARDYSDPTCETPAAVLRDGTCPAPAIVTHDEGGPCRPYFAVDDTPEPTAFANIVNSCMPLDPIEGAVIYGGSEQLDIVTFSRAVESSAGRMQLIYVNGPDAARDARIRERDVFYDAALDTECVLTLRDFNDWVCVPVLRTTGTSFVYTDDQCTQGVYVTWIPDGGDSLWPCMPHKPQKYSWDGDREVRPIGDVQPGPLYQSTFKGCQPADFTNATPHTLGALVTTPLVHASMVFD